MILYKYVSFDAAIKIINTSSIGFSCADHLNDPFECTAFGFCEPDQIRSKTHVATNAYRSMLSRCYAILSLTRQPLNSLMWAHYGCGHQGVAIGFDSKKAGFESTDSSIIPSQFGEVIYTSTKPVNISTPGAKELADIANNVNGFQPDIYNILKRGFLYKSIEWGYEEEVRVVKNIRSPIVGYDEVGEFKNISGEWNKINIKSLGRPIYCLSIPIDSIVELFLGRNISHNVSKPGGYSEGIFHSITNNWKELGIEIRNCDVDYKTWNLIAR